MKLSRYLFIYGLAKLYTKFLRIKILNGKFKKPAIFAFWHGKMLLLPFVFSGIKGVSVLVSKHEDGEFASRILSYCGFDTIRGSFGKGKGGAAAFMKMLSCLKKGKGIAITPDGPTGPYRVVKEGVIRLALLANVPIYPVSFGCNSGRNLSSWDRFFVPYPFSRCNVSIGDPIYLDGTRSILELTEEVTEALNRLDSTCEEKDG